MRFLAFIFNSIFKIISFFSLVVVEVVLFSLIYKALINQGMSEFAGYLFYVFLAWIIIDIILRIFLGTGKSIIRYIFSIWHSSR